MTVARVLNHTAGLNRVDYYPLPGDLPLPTIEESLDGDNGGGQSVRIDMEPGRQYNYSNAGNTLLQLMIEEVSGRRFSDYMQEVILDPLGMTNRTFDPDKLADLPMGRLGSFSRWSVVRCERYKLPGLTALSDARLALDCGRTPFAFRRLGFPASGGLGRGRLSRFVRLVAVCEGVHEHPLPQYTPHAGCL